MSQLPDDSFFSLISHLSLKEAGATSVLSSQWLHAWKSINRLVFDGSKELNILAEKLASIPWDQRRGLLYLERVKYIKWVNEVLRQHEGSMLEEFRIRFDLDKNHKTEIDSWFQYAFARKVQRLEVNLEECSCNVFRHSPDTYNFPSELLPLTINSRPPHPKSSFDHYNILANFKSLKCISFKCVYVNDEDLEFFLSNCPYLEQLTVDGSATLKNITISGTSLALKHLKLIRCGHLTSVKVRNANLVSLEVWRISALVMENLPSLAQVMLGTVTNIDSIFSTLSNHLAQLEFLTLNISFFPQLEHISILRQLEIIEQRGDPLRAIWLCLKYLKQHEILLRPKLMRSKYLKQREYPSLPKLMRLKVCGYAKENESLMGYVSLIQAAPCLAEFELQLLWIEGSGMPFEIDPTKTLGGPMKHLKKVKLAGYRGSAPDFDFVMFFLRRAHALEELTIDTTDQYYVDSPRAIDIKKKEEVRNRAKEQLEGKMPSRVRLVFL